MPEKFLINSVGSCVAEALRGASVLRPSLHVDIADGIAFDASCCDADRVGVISGGGSGHEPFPSGYVSKGLLSAGVCGAIFTSPPSKHILTAIRMVAARSSSVLLLVPNYTGDVLNFGLAAENAVGEGIRVESVVVGDDVSQEGGGSKAGKRGICGMVLVVKVAGYLSGRGEELATVKKWSEEAVASMASMGLCVKACSKPGVGALFELEEDEVEIGVGVHGEAGVGRRKLMSAAMAVETLLDRIMPSLELTSGDEAVVLVNNLGSLTVIEEWLLAGEAHAQLTSKGISVLRIFSGRFFTSLNMAGVQICVLKLREDTRKVFLSAVDQPTTGFAWSDGGKFLQTPPKQSKQSNPLKGPSLSPEQARILADALRRISRDLAKEEARLNELDSVCGDGDCGTTFSQMAAVVESSAERWDCSDPCGLFSSLCSLLEESIGGTTGALYGLFLRGVSAELAKNETVDGFVAAECWKSGVETIKKYSLARIGDRTMLDSLELGCRSFETNLKELRTPEEALQKAVEAAVDGCRQTKTMKARAGRASYTDREQNDVDAGAFAVEVWLKAIQEAFNDPN